MSKLQTVNNLPNSHNQELIKAVNQLSEKAGNLDQILVQFDQINKAQRQSLQGLADEISNKAVQSLQQQLMMLTSKTTTLEQTLLKVEKASEFMEKAQNSIHKSANQLKHQPWLKLMGLAVITALLASLLTVAGTHGLRLLQQKNETQLQQIMDKATPQEIEWLNKIYSRPDT